LAFWTVEVFLDFQGKKLDRFYRTCSGFFLRVQNTMIYTHVLNKGGHGVNSPVDIFITGLG
jgi:hypothetical protein